mmetsp:Transcript_12328/g.19013  ORF Transcript_12328/g.19013 Transcript_12328/m.19013 type:complete len:100 (-) Transcript_12328:211-510(-)
MIVVLVDRRIVMIATNMNVTTAMKRSVQSALREADMAINVKTVMQCSVQNAMQMRQGCVVVVNVMTYVAMIVDFKLFDEHSNSRITIVENASNKLRIYW